MRSKPDRLSPGGRPLLATIRMLASTYSKPTIAAMLALLLGPSPAVAEVPLVEDLTRLSLEDLMDVEVTSVSKRREKRSEAAAAVFVITPEQIRRWGVTNIPDALRMVPGLHVARIDANKWAISARGFNSRFANQLLVLIDGRTVYTPLFAGVYWDMQDLPLEDIERIEVIRGPGGTLWGANAVNGVINIITKPARQTQGGRVSLIAGTEDRGIATVRHGGRLAPGAWYRAYAKYRSTDEGHAPDPQDDGSLGQAGFRSDWEGEADQVTIQGDYYRGESGQRLTIPVDPPPAQETLSDDADLRGANLLARWRRGLGDGSAFMLQAYLDHVSRDGRVLNEDRNILDIEMQHDLAFDERNRVVWGLGYRRTHDDTDCNDVFCLSPSSRSVDLFSGFAQLENALVPDTLFLTVGTKLEHNDFTGVEYQPNARLSWLAGPGHTLWAALSRAVRTPSRGEHDVQLRVLPSGPPSGVPWVLQGNRDFDSERLWAYELGYRWQGSRRVSLDVAAFYNDYSDLRSFDPDIPPPPVLGLPFDNRLEGETYGFEAVAEWQASDIWRLHGSYSYLKLDLQRADGSRDTLSESVEGSSPRHQARFSSLVNLGPDLEWDTVLRYTDSIRTASGKVPSYWGLDMRLGWRVGESLELSLAGRNLLDDHHPEFPPDFIQTQETEVERSVHVSLGWHF